MKFIADRAELKGKLVQVAPAVAKLATLPVLEHVLLKAQGDRLELRASNLETGIQVKLPVVVEQEGACTVPFERLLDWVKVPLPKDTITVTLTSDMSTGKRPVSLRIQCGRNNCTLKSLLPEEEAPAFPTVDGVTAVVDADNLATAIKGVQWATMTEKYGMNNPERTGILLEVIQNVLTLVALDGFNVAVCDCPLLGGFMPKEPVIVNKPSMLAVASVLSGEVVISVGEGHIVFKTSDVTIVATTLMGTFPDYAGVLAAAERGEKTWVMERKDVARLFKAVAPFAEYSYGGPVFVHVELSSSTIKVEGESPDLGDCVGSVDAQGEQDIRFAVSPAYIKKAVGSIAADQLMFVLSEPDQALLIRAVESERHKIVMMPVTVQTPFERVTGEKQEGANE